MKRVLKYALTAGAAAYLVCFVCLAVLRMRYPYELEWLEGGSVDHVARIMAGERLYVPPTADFIPFIYSPFYYYIAALVSKLTGLGFTPLRLVSFVASLGCMLIVYLFVRRETNSRFPAFLAACLFAATYRLSGAWMDIARVDSLFLLLLLWGLYTVRFLKGPWRQSLAGVLITLAFLTKQIALLSAVPVMLLAVAVDRRRSVPFVATAVVLSAAAYFVLDHIHGGFYGYYTVDLPRQHALVGRFVLSFWTNDLALPLSVALALAILYLYLQRLRGARLQFLFYSCAAIGAVGGSWISKIHLGSFSNVLLPAHAIVAILFGLGMHEARELTRREPLSRYPFAKSFLLIVCIMQFAGLAYNPGKLLPSPADRRAGRALIETVSRIDGDVFLPFHPYYLRMAGKRSCAHHMAMRDVLRGDDCPQRQELVRDIRQRMRDRRYAAVILDTQSWDFVDDVHTNYEGPEPLSGDETAFYPVTGAQFRPALIWRAGEAGAPR